MSLSEGNLILTITPTTNYVVNSITGTTNYTATTSINSKYTVDNILQGLFLGKQVAVETDYVVYGYFAGAEIF
jgi:hypothetical protein